jgi:histidine triad (HIT) family protein
MVKNECVFCKIVSGEIKSKKVYDSDNFLAFLDINPRAEGHTVIVPKQHFKTMLDTPDSLGAEMMRAVKEVAVRLIRDKKYEGFNVIINNFPAAGQVVHHMHVHVLPRRDGDGLNVFL